jgi:prolyl-tRNA editing enzyme YbaK/EbsC (Cys-tRNA(Pro) deacylase)
LLAPVGGGTWGTATAVPGDPQAFAYASERTAAPDLRFAACTSKKPSTSSSTVNCILVASRTGEKKYAACLVQATRRLDVNRTVRGLIGARKVSFAPADETVEVTGMTPGGVTPFALPAGLPIYVDAPVMDLEEIILGGGGRSTKVLVTPAVLTKMPAVTVVTDLAR